MVPIDWKTSPRACACSAKRATAESTDKRHVRQRVRGYPWVDDVTLELVSRFRRHGDRTGDLLDLREETMRDLNRFGFKLAQCLCAGRRLVRN